MGNNSNTSAKPARTAPRSDIYYWKCDRPAALHGTTQDIAQRSSEELQRQVAAMLERRFGAIPPDLRPGGGQGNHFFFRATIEGKDCMIRIENGPEHDDYMEVEAHVIGLVKKAGVPSWNFLGVNSSRKEDPFAWQVIERVPGHDLNALLKEKKLDLPACAEHIGAHVARWQSIRTNGFGPFRPDVLRGGQRLLGYHTNYADYYHTRLTRHLDYLVCANFLSETESADIAAVIHDHAALLQLPDTEGGILVHKDLALWNIIGEEPDRITAVIDWDDTVSGDPMDDISLLACFYDGPVIARALKGYASVRTLPVEYEKRFWLHLLRNMIWKSVIRVGAGYFKLDNSFFLVSANGDGSGLREFTLKRIRDAVRGLRKSQDPRLLNQ